MVQDREANLLVQNVTNEAASNEADDGGQGDGLGRGGEGHTSNEDDSLDTLTQDCDEGKDEHGVLLERLLEPALGASLEGGLEGLGELDAPLGLHLTDTEQSSAHDGDNKGGEEGEGALVVVLVLLPRVAADGVEDADESGGNDHADEEAYTGAEPDL